jgi:[glutamine synthetase] adenylyltransferase / [glutamine synthetase]-adenylyl-L-tyrosine phosphorylase
LDINSLPTHQVLASIQQFPKTVQEFVADKVQQLVSTDADILKRSEPHTGLLLKAIAVSDFLTDIILKNPGAVVSWLHTQRFRQNGQITRSVMQMELNSLLEGVQGEDSLAKILRVFRRNHMFAIVFRDLVLQESFQVTAREVSWLAEVCIDAALTWHDRELSKQFGYPADKEGNRQQLVVLGMGKLGAGELNVSSDIDLIFAFAKSGATIGGQRSLDNQSYFVRLGQKLIQSLDTVTADGFVFRVDMRLRPYGQSGALALSFNAMEEYYADQGRDWERYAMIKAAPVAGDIERGRQLLADLRPFVYRKYVDFGAIQSLRSMKEMIVKDVRRRGMNQNIKVGNGGIREVEFIAQVFQLIRGGRVQALQQRSLIVVLSELLRLQLLPETAVRELSDSYVFLRNLEHAIQGLNDKQTQLIPSSTLSRSRIAVGMGFSDWNDCQLRLNYHRQRVANHFGNVIAEPDQRRTEDPSGPLWRQLWLSKVAADQLVALFPDCAQTDIDSSLQQLIAFRNNARIIQLQAQGRERLDRFMPLMLKYFALQKGDADTFSRLLRFVESVARRSAYLALLNENLNALKELIRLFAESSWIAEQIIITPMLLDELLRSESLYSPPDMATLNDELRQQMLRIPEDDLEEQMEALRYFKKAHVLRVAASEVRETLPLMKVSDYLSFIAETILNQVFEQAWSALTAKYGVPVRSDGTLCDRDFGIIGYGKLGGIELSYGSDLDLVFLHDCDANSETNGGRSIDSQLFFTRLGQRIIHLLATKTASGDIYEVDMRLRPSGNSGLLVSSLQAFRKYQLKDAWTWEHQALVRTRIVSGSEHIRHQFHEVRQQVLTSPRDNQKLRTDVLEMRNKMKVSLATKADADGNYPHFDLKQDPGGIVDIEFMVQYAALRWAYDHPEVIRWSDNIRILDALSVNHLLAEKVADDLCDIYRKYRSRGHHLVLRNRPARVGIDEFTDERARVSEIWLQLFEV